MMMGMGSRAKQYDDAKNIERIDKQVKTMGILTSQSNAITTTPSNKPNVDQTKQDETKQNVKCDEKSTL